MNNFKVYCTWPKKFKNLNSRINECSELVINYFYVSFFRKRDTLAGIVLKPLLAVLELASIVMKLDTCLENAHRRKREWLVIIVMGKDICPVIVLTAADLERWLVIIVMRMVTCLEIVQRRTKGERRPVIIAKGKVICPATVQMAAVVVAAEAVEVSKSLIITMNRKFVGMRSRL